MIWTSLSSILSIFSCSLTRLFPNFLCFFDLNGSLHVVPEIPLSRHFFSEQLPFSLPVQRLLLLPFVLLLTRFSAGAYSDLYIDRIFRSAYSGICQLSNAPGFSLTRSQEKRFRLFALKDIRSAVPYLRSHSCNACAAFLSSQLCQKEKVFSGFPSA